MTFLIPWLGLTLAFLLLGTVVSQLMAGWRYRGARIRVSR